MVAGWVLIPPLLIYGTGGTAYMLLATYSYGLMVMGLCLRHHLYWHVKLMPTAMALDLGLVGILEYQRSAIDVALSNTLSGWQMSHVIVSTLAALLYVPVFILGRKRWKQTGGSRIWHIRLGLTAFVLRTLGFFLMFSMLGRLGYI